MVRNFTFVVFFFIMSDNVTAAIRAVHDGLSTREAAKTFGVSSTTLMRRLRNPFPQKSGGQTTFTAYEERDTLCGSPCVSIVSV